MRNELNFYCHKEDGSRIDNYDNKHNLEEVSFLTKKINEKCFEIIGKVDDLVVGELNFDIIRNRSELMFLGTVNNHRETINFKRGNQLIKGLGSKLIDLYVEELIQRDLRYFELYSMDHAIGFYQKKFDRMKEQGKINKVVQMKSNFFIDIY